MKDILKKLIYLILFLNMFNTVLFAQNNCIDYYGIVSKELDNNMAKMTSDLYYTQLSELQDFTIYDKRTTSCKSDKPDFKKIDTENLIFYSEILKTSDNVWTVIFSIVDNSKDRQFKKNKNYDSFYKILIESKNDLKIAINELISGDSEMTTADNKDKSETNIPYLEKTIKISSIEQLSGTWKGEDTIDKIVILRGGRGFVILKNGASMNITVSIEEINNEQFIIIQQKSNSNASFYPELPRKIALEAATSAPPIKWTMTLFENMIMSGLKTTLIQDKETFIIGTIPVIWEKIN